MVSRRAADGMHSDNVSTVLVVDAEPATRNSIVELAKSKGFAVEGYASVNDFLHRFDGTLPGCVVLQLRFGGTADLQPLMLLKQRKCRLPIVVLAAPANIPLAVQAMQAGAHSFLEAPASDAELMRAIDRALEHDRANYLHQQDVLETESRLASLTADELEVFRRLLAGHANKRIASDLDIGLRTVELRRSNIMKKMQATSLPDLVRMAILLNLLSIVRPETPAAGELS